MPTTAEQPIPMWSQQFLDKLALAYHRAIAARLLADPDEVLAVARDNLRRWLKVHEGTGAAYALEEWLTLLDTKTVPELISIITEDSDEGQRLRSSTPFAGVLPEEERKEIFARYEEGIFV